LGLTVDTNKLSVGITPEYRNQVRELLLESWPISRRIFKVADIQKLVGKMARLGEGAPWIYKIMSHIYTSLAFALKQNKELLLTCSPKYREIVESIKRKQFPINQSDCQRVKFCFENSGQDGESLQAGLRYQRNHASRD